MAYAVLVLAILFLAGVNVGKALAICAIINGILTLIWAVSGTIKKHLGE